MIADIPTFKQQKEYTPKGFVDLDVEWFSQNLVIVARAKENKEWKEGAVPTMFTSLNSINIRTGEQKQISFPKKNEFDEDPQVVRSYLSLVRRKSEGFQGDVWVREGISGQEHLWIKNVDSAPVFYEQK